MNLGDQGSVVLSCHFSSFVAGTATEVNYYVQTMWAQQSNPIHQAWPAVVVVMGPELVSVQKSGWVDVEHFQQGQGWGLTLPLSNLHTDGPWNQEG